MIAKKTMIVLGLPEILKISQRVFFDVLKHTYILLLPCTYRKVMYGTQKNFHDPTQQDQ